MSSDQKEECSSVLSAPLFGDENTAPTQVDEGKVAIQGVSDNSVSSAPATKFNNILEIVHFKFQNCEFKFS